MLFSYEEIIKIYKTDYMLKKALKEKSIYKIEKGIYSDGKNNFTSIELVLKKYKDAFLVKDTALNLIGFIKDEPTRIHIGTARNALRIKDERVHQHFYGNLDNEILHESKWLGTEYRFLCSNNIKKYTTENGNEIRMFNLKALLFDVMRNYKKYTKEDLLYILDKFKNCSQFYDLDRWDFEYNLAYENVISEIEFLDNDIYEMLEDIFSEVDYREFKMKYGLY